MKVPFFKLSVNRADKAEVLKTLDSGWLTSGPKCSELEELVRSYIGSGHPVALSSATGGLHLALLALDIGPGDEVITTGFTFSATVAAILYVGAQPVLADIDSATLNIDPASIEQRITNKTRAIISVDIAGLPCDFKPIRALCKKHDLKLISDSAHSLGASYHNQPVGAQADVTVFSFYSTKTITTGEGGLALCRNQAVADRIRRLALHGIDNETYKRNKSGSWRYDIAELGYKYNLSDISAALGVARMKRLDKLLAARQSVANRYTRSLKKFGDMFYLPLESKQSTRAWHLYIIRLNLSRWKISRDRFIDELKERGIGSGVHYIPVYQLSHFVRELNLERKNFPETEKAFSEVVSLPLYPELGAADVKTVTTAISVIADKFSA